MRILRYVGLGVLWVVLVGYFVYLRFPYERLRPAIETQLTKVGAVQLDYASAGPDGLGGVRLTGLDVTPRPRRGGAAGAEPVTYRIDRLDVRPHLLSLVRGRAGARIDARAFGGRIRGVARQAGDEGVVVDATAEGVDLGRVPMPADGGISGTLDAEVSALQLPPGGGLASASGSVVLSAAAGEVLPFQTGAARIPPQTIAYDTFSARALLEEGAATVEELVLSGPDLSARATGEITLARRLMASRVSGELKVRFDNDLSLYEDVVKGFTRAKKDGDGFLVLPLRGTLGRPF